MSFKEKKLLGHGISWAQLEKWLGGRRWWLSIIFLLPVLWVPVFSVEQAEWITPHPSLVVVLALAIVLSWVLGRSRLSGFIISSVVVVTGFLVTIWQIYPLLSIPESLSSAGKLSFAFQSWWQAMTITEPGIGMVQFATLLVFCTWIFGYVSTWFIVRRQNPWIAISLGAIIIFANLSNLPEKHYTSFFLFILVSLLFLGIMRLIKQTPGLENNGIYYTKRSVAYFFISLLLLSTLVATVSRFTPEVRVTQLENTVRAQSLRINNIERRLNDLFSTIETKQPMLKSSEKSELLLGDSGFDRGRQRQFIVTSPQPSYWRTHMFNVYSNTGWTSSNTTEQMLREGSAGTGSEGESNRSEITYFVETRLKTDIILNSGEFISSDKPVSIKSLAPSSFDIDLSSTSVDNTLPPDVASLSRSLRSMQGNNEELNLDEVGKLLPEDLVITGPDNSPTDTIRLTRVKKGNPDTVSVATPYFLKPDSRYTVTNSIVSATPDELSEAGDIYPNRIKDYYIQLPSNLPSGVKRLSETVTEEHENNYDKVIAIKQHLSKMEYSREVEAPPEEVDGVYYFLFVEKSGNCVHFSSAMAVMLRSVGIPSRISVGYAPGEWDKKTGHSILRAEQRHAWPEVYFPGYGWVGFEATPPLDIESGALLGGSNYLDEYDEYWYYYDTGEEWVEDSIAGEGTSAGSRGSGFQSWGRIVLPLTIVCIILVVFIPWILLSRWLKTSMKSELATEVYRKLCRLASLAKSGPRSPQTPLEFCTEMALALPSQAEAIENIVQYYVRSAYSPKKELELMESWNLLKSWREVYPVLLKRLFRIKY